MLYNIIEESINKTTIACFLKKATTNYTTFNNDRCTAIIAHKIDPTRIAVPPINENQPMVPHESTKAHEEIAQTSTKLLIVDLSPAIAQASTEVPAKSISDTLHSTLLDSLKIGERPTKKQRVTSSKKQD